MGWNPQELVGNLQRFGLERDRMRAALARSLRISSTDLDALEHLEADGPLTQRDLGQRLSLTSGAITMLVDRLVALDWVERRPHPTDRRYHLVELSERALRDMPDVLVRYHSAVLDAAKRLPTESRRDVARFLGEAASAAASATSQLSDRPA